VRRAMRRAGDGAIPAMAAATAEKQHDVLVFGEVRIDFTSMEAERSGGKLTLTAQEFKVLKFFAGSPGTVISRAKLLNEVWGYENYPTTRTVDNHILRLRQKLEPDPSNPRYFLTVHGAGYKFTPGASTSASGK
jgi:DNA-binding response OmpR family regulator